MPPGGDFSSSQTQRETEAQSTPLPGSAASLALLLLQDFVLLPSPCRPLPPQTRLPRPTYLSIKIFTDLVF